MSARPGRVVSLDGGLGILTDALAAPLRIRYGSAVLRVEAAGRRVRVTTSQGRLHADAAIVAVPGQAALSMLADRSRLERRLMSTPYS